MHRRYLIWLATLAACTFLPAVALNVLLLQHEGNVTTMSVAASRWQHQTHGITYSPTMGKNGPFKTLRLQDRLPEIDTVVLGPSTSFAIEASMMPVTWRPYNFAQSGNPLESSIAQAEYLLAHAPQVHHYLISLDWAIGFVYRTEPITPVDLQPAAAPTVNSPTLPDLLREAASYPRMETLGRLIGRIASSPTPAKTFREYFLQSGSDEYLCPDGITPGKDFGIHYRGLCNGFRYDGSATFAGYPRVADPAPLLIRAVASDSQYVQGLRLSRGTVSPILLDHLERLNRQITAQGGQMILFLPPLLPGMEQAFLKHPEWSALLARTKDELRDWAANRHIRLADFGQSEQFGCLPEDFIDEHHAAAPCYRKVFDKFWGTLPSTPN